MIYPTAPQQEMRLFQVKLFCSWFTFVMYLTVMYDISTRMLVFVVAVAYATRAATRVATLLLLPSQLLHATATHTLLLPAMSSATPTPADDDMRMMWHWGFIKPVAALATITLLLIRLLLFRSAGYGISSYLIVSNSTFEADLMVVDPFIAPLFVAQLLICASAFQGSFIGFCIMNLI